MTKARVRVGGKIYEGWKSASVQVSLESIARVFSLSFIDAWSPSRKAWGINPQDEVTIEMGAQRILSGSIETLSGDLSNERGYTAQGRSRTADIIDCSPPESPAQFRNITLLNLCHALCKDLGIKFTLASMTIDNSPFSSWTIQPGETIFESLDKAARLRGVLLVPDADGNVVISQRGVLPSGDILIEGQNCRALSLRFDYSERFSDYIVRGQDKEPEGFAGTAVRVRGTAEDLGVKRRRLMVMQLDARASSADAKKRAAWEASVRAARSQSVTVEVPGGLRSSGRPWAVNELITFRAPRLGGEGTFLITETEFNLSQEGSVTRLTLYPPDAFAGDPTVKKKKADQVAKGWVF